MASETRYVPFREYRTWCEIFGDLKCGTLPLIILHGGPAATHWSLSGLSKLSSKYGFPVVFYDQLGCGQSTLLPHKGADFWTVQLFLDELDNLLRSLQIREYNILGHSWGGELAAEHAVRQPVGLKHLILVGAPADNSLLEGEMGKLIAKLPEKTQKAIKEHQEDGTTDSPEYQAAMRVWFRTYVCRANPVPPVFAEHPSGMFKNNVYLTMNGPSEFHMIGTLKDWKILDRIHLIKAKTLAISGKYDEVTDPMVLPYIESVRDISWIKFENSAHMPHLEETERFMEVVGDFLRTEMITSDA